VKRAAVLTLALLVSLVVAADTPKGGGAEKEKELKKLQGKWLVVALVQNGKEVPEKNLKDARLTLRIKGNTFTFTTPKRTQQGTVSIDPSKKPKTIDLLETPEKGKEKKKAVLGIYEWVGPKLKIAADEKKRPSEFKSVKDGALVMTLQRADD